MRDWLKKIRKDLGYTQQQVADYCEVTEEHIGLIESGQRRPSPELAQKIAVFLKFEWSIFFENTSNKSNQAKQKVIKEVKILL